MLSIKSMLVGLTATTLATGTASAQGLFGFEPADSDFYVAGYIGGAFPFDVDLGVDVEFDTGFTVGGAVGASLPFKSFFGLLHPRLELEVSHLNFDFSDDTLAAFDVPDGLFNPSVTPITILGNSYADLEWRENQFLVPYFGGGLGATFEAGDTIFTGTTALGLTARLTERFDVYGEARYFRFYDSGPDVDGINLLGGVRLRF